jgi:hypothetical protein
MKLCNLAQPQMSMLTVQIPVGYSGPPSVTNSFPRTPVTGEPETLPIGICGAKFRPRTLNPFLEGAPGPYCPFKQV